MAKQQQPDYKKSQNDPYDLNNVVRPRPEAPKPPATPSPYDLIEGAKVRTGKDEESR
jgi:hypothetical protein